MSTGDSKFRNQKGWREHGILKAGEIGTDERAHSREGKGCSSRQIPKVSCMVFNVRAGNGVITRNKIVLRFHKENGGIWILILEGLVGYVTSRILTFEL